MQHYGIAPAALLASPVRLLWSMHRYVDRLRAESDLRALNVQLCAAVTAQGEEKFHAELRAQLLEQMGTVTRTEEKPSSRDDLAAFMQVNAA